MKTRKKTSAYQQLQELMPWMVPPVDDDTSSENKAKLSPLGYLVAVLMLGLFLLFIALLP